MIDWEGRSFAQYFHVPAFSRDLLIIQLFNIVIKTYHLKFFSPPIVEVILKFVHLIYVHVAHKISLREHLTIM